MPLITLDNISLRFSEKIILDEINATILKGDKIALIVETVKENLASCGC